MSIHQKKYFSGPAHDRHLAQVKERKDVARQVAREFAYEYLLTHPCEHCGESDVRVLEFHHTGDKDMAVAAMVSAGYSIERIEAEINKCTILCANCHRKLTVEERGWFRKKR
jgi:uracil phosphoribosyltransferase